MVGAEAVDVRDGLFKRIDRAHAEGQVEVLRAPVRLRRRLAGHAGRTKHRLCALVRADAHARRVQRLRRSGQRRPRLFMHEQRLHGVAGRGVLRLGVHDDARGHLRVRVLVQVEVAHAVAVAQHRDARVVHDVAHKGVGAARDDEVDVLVEREHLAHVLARGQQPRPAHGQARSLAGLLQHGVKRRIGVHRLAPALEQHGVAALHAQPGNLHQRVRPGLEDDADHADGAAHAGEDQPVRQLRAQLLAADGVLHRRQRAQAREHVGKLRLVKAQALSDRRGQLRRGVKVQPVRREDLLPARMQRVGHGQQRAAAHRRRRRSQRKARLPRSARGLPRVTHRSPGARAPGPPPPSQGRPP